MIVDQFNTYPHGGAATAAKRIHEQLNKMGIESRFFYHLNDKQVPLDDSYRQLEFSNDASQHVWWKKLQRGFEKRRVKRIHRQYDTHLAGHKSDGETFSMAELTSPTQLPWHQIGGDIVHLHWTSFFIDYPSFFRSIPNDIPIVWTLHDMNAFTGGCHYSGDCRRFEQGCGHCVQIRNAGEHDLSHHTFRLKQNVLRDREIHVVTPSLWLCAHAQRSPIWSENTVFHVINYGLDLEAFRPIDKAAARQTLAINSDAVLIGFGAEDINNRRKGIQHLLKSLQWLPTATPVECLVFGDGDIPPLDGLPKMHRLGYVDSVEKQRQVYSAADFVVVPSREDNQPQIGLEAMACGTPVVGFQAGGIPEYVQVGVNGLLAEIGDERDLANQMAKMVDHTERRKAMGERARRYMELNFEAETQTEKYIDLYRCALLGKQLVRNAA